MATYNGEKYISQQLDSILSQTVMPTEIIIQDDCSSDSTRKILHDYSSKHEIIKLFFNEKNLGFKNNFASACMKANCDYIALADQDDIWLPNHLKVLIESIKDKAMSCADALLVDSDNNSMNLTFSETKKLYYVPVSDLEKSYRILYGSYGGFLQGASMLFKRSLYDILFPIPQSQSFHDVWITIVTCFVGGFNYSTEIITRYRQHGANVTENIKLSFLREMFRRTHIDYVPGRLDAVIALKERIKGLDDKLTAPMAEVTDLLDQFINYSSDCKCFRNRFKCWKFRSLHYSEIYSTRSNRKKFFQSIQYLLTPSNNK